MKTTNKLFGMALIAIVTIVLFACGGNDSDPTPEPTPEPPTPETFTVTFHANGGTPEPTPQPIEKGKTATEPQGVTKAKNALGGWFKETALTTQWNFTADTVTANIDLYAKWNCNCPNGTLHLVGETCCDGTGCTCEKNIAGQRVNEIPVTNRQNVSAEDFATQIAAIEEALEWVEEYSAPGQLALIKANIKEIRIIPGPATVAPVINQDVMTIQAGTNSSDTFNAFDRFTVE